MGRVLTNNVSLSYAVEQTLGVLPGSPVWKLLEPNEINTFGSTVTTVARSPISKNRQRRKGVVTDLDSAVEFTADLTADHFIDFAECFLFASFNGPLVFAPTAVTSGGSSGYTVPASGDLVANELVFAAGFTNSGNNGLKLVATGSTTTNIRVDGLTAEASPPANVAVDVCGVRGAVGDIEIDVNGNIISTVLDFTTLSLTAGQTLWVGGVETVNSFAVAGNRGYVRIVSVATNLITIDKTTQAFSIDDGATKLIDLYFGRFGRNVTTDDGDYLEQSLQFEGEYPNLETPGPGDEYEYAKGNYCNQMTFDLPLTDKAGLTFGFVGTDTEPPTTTRATDADTPLLPLKTAPFGTASDIARLRITEVDETGLTTDFKSLSLVMNNNASPEKVLGTLGAKYVNTGNFEVDIEAQLVFTEGAVVTAIRSNTTVTMDFAVRNADDGAIHIDIPSMTLGEGDREFPVNESVLINTTGMAFQDTILGTSIGVSILPYVPAS